MNEDKSTEPFGGGSSEAASFADVDGLQKYVSYICAYDPPPEDRASLFHSYASLLSSHIF